MAASVPIPLFSAPGRKAVPIAIAALGVIGLLRLGGLASDGAPGQNSSQPSRITYTFLRQPAARVGAAALGSSARNTCVMALGGNGKSSVGLKRDVVVSLAACDLYNASREADSTELVGQASLSARNIFLAGDYALSPGAVMSAARYLETHASPAANPYSRLAVPSYSGCARTNYKLDAGKTGTVSPGVYCGGIEAAGGATLNLDPGTYFLDQGNFTVSGSATVKGTGVTIILTSRSGSNYGTVDIQSGSTVAITAPASDAAAGIPGIAIWVDWHAPAAGATLNGGDTQNINGAIYLPSRRVQYSGGSPSGTRCSQLVALAVTFTGNSYFRHDCAGAGVADPTPPPLFLE